MPTRTAAACETWIWGNRLNGASQGAMDLLTAGMIDPNSTEGAAWLEKVNSILGQATNDLESMLASLPA